MIIRKSPTTTDEFKTYCACRYHGLREPLGFPRGSEKDDYEPIAQHLMAMDDSPGKIIAIIKLAEN